MLYYTGLPVIMAGVAVAMDLRTAKVDNGWIAFSLILGLIVRYMREGIHGIFIFASGVILPLLLLGVLYAFRMLGPGDIKLLCAMGGVMGSGKILKCIFFSLILGAGISIAILISNGDISQRFHYFYCYFRNFARTGQRKPYYRTGMSHLENFHFTVPVFLSAVLYAGGVY